MGVGEDPSCLFRGNQEKGHLQAEEDGDLGELGNDPAPTPR